MSFTFAELKTAIQDFTENTETTFVNNISRFIRTAEDRIFYMVDLEYFRKNATSALTQNDPFLSLPTDFLASFSLSITNGSSKQFLLPKDINFIQEAHTNSTSTGTPLYYARFDVDNLLLGPTPDSNYVCEFHYFYRPASLTAGADSGTTWLSTNAPKALLYGSLYEAYIYMKGEPDMLELYDRQFSEALGRLKDLAEARENTDAYRRGLPDRPRT
tara:strand:+ start:92 stop:739 length:648 start_codon:yes stop_codon:yes gene_type:complete